MKWVLGGDGGVGGIEGWGMGEGMGVRVYLGELQ